MRDNERGYGMLPGLSAARWRKSSFSGGEGGQCVELAHTRDEIRDSKNPDGPTLRVPVGALLKAIKATG